MSPPATVPVKAAPVVLDPAWDMDRALKAAVGGCLAHFLANAGLAARSRNVEYLHQARVALRRMRSVLRLRQPAEPTLASLLESLRAVSGALGPARDWDVLLETTLPPILRDYAHATRTPAPDAAVQRVLSAAKRRRGSARRAARDALAPEKVDALAGAVERWMDSPAPPDLHLATLVQACAAEVRRRHRRLLRDGAGLVAQDPAQRHQVRIDAKRLRYAVEFCGSLFPPEAVRRYAQDLAGLQDALGALNDSVVAARLLAGLPGAGPAGGFMLGWIAARETDSVAAARQALDRIADSPRFWKPTPPTGGQA